MTNIDQVEILLAEDSQTDYELTLRALKKIGMADKVHWVKDGSEVLDYLFGEGVYLHRPTRKPPRLVLLDLKMPKVDGIQALKRIKSDERTKTIPVVMLTSSKEEQDIVDSYKLGVNSYIVKPVNFSNFLETISNAGLYWMLINQTIAAA